MYLPHTNACAEQGRLLTHRHSAIRWRSTTLALLIATAVALTAAIVARLLVLFLLLVLRILLVLLLLLLLLSPPPLQVCPVSTGIRAHPMPLLALLSHSSSQRNQGPAAPRYPVVHRAITRLMKVSSLCLQHHLPTLRMRRQDTHTHTRTHKAGSKDKSEQLRTSTKLVKQTEGMID